MNTANFPRRSRPKSLAIKRTMTPEREAAMNAAYQEAIRNLNRPASDLELAALGCDTRKYKLDPFLDALRSDMESFLVEQGLRWEIEAQSLAPHSVPTFRWDGRGQFVSLHDVTDDLIVLFELKYLKKGVVTRW